MTQLKMPLYYYDSNGYKIGPINKKELYALVEKGAISPETRITDDNIEIQAKHIPKLKFYAPEYHSAEELFNPDNINFDSVIPIHTTEETLPTVTTTIAQETKHQTETIELLPENNKKKYIHFHNAIEYNRPMIAIIWYGGIALSIIATIITTFLILPLAPLVLILGIICAHALKTKQGIRIDNLQWKIDVEKHMREIKSRLNQND